MGSLSVTAQRWLSAVVFLVSLLLGFSVAAHAQMVNCPTTYAGPSSGIMPLALNRSMATVCGGQKGQAVRVYVTILGGHAGWSQQLNFLGSSVPSGSLSVGPTKPQQYMVWNAGNPSLTRVMLPGIFSFGDVLIFQLIANNGHVKLKSSYSGHLTGNLFAFGPNAPVHLDWNSPYFIPNTPYPGGVTYGFDDSGAGPDRDYNDLVFAVETQTITPEPVSMTLLATGLGGLGLAGLRRRRNLPPA